MYTLFMQRILIVKDHCDLFRQIDVITIPNIPGGVSDQVRGCIKDFETWSSLDLAKECSRVDTAYKMSNVFL